MKKSIFLFFAAILCAMSVQGANTMRIYCKQAQSWWKSDGAAVGAYYWGTGGNANSWPGTRMTKVSGQTDLWYIDVDIDKYQKIIFTRVNGSGAVSDWGAKTGDLAIANTKNQYTISSSSAVWGDPGVTGSWGTYKPTSTAALATSAANIFVGGQATLTSSLTSNTSANTIKETAYAISPAGANVSGNTFTATAEGTYTVTATVTYYPLGCPTLTSTATATTTIVAEVPAEETHDVTVSYICGETKVADPTTVNTVGVETPVKVTAPEIAKYTFANWTLGADVATTDALTSNEINITTKAGGSDFTLTANYEKFKLTYTVTVPAGTENCYLVGEMNGWDVDNPIEMANQGNNIFKVVLEDVTTDMQYKYISKKGTWDYSEVGDNRTWTANDVVTAWKDPLATDVYLAGSMTDWANSKLTFKKATIDATTATVSVELAAGTEYYFKVIRGGDWTSSKDNRDIKASVSGLVFSKDIGDNTKLTTAAAGNYVFTWDINQSQLSIAYPSIPVDAYNVTVPEGTIECYIKGAFDDWAEFHKMTKVDETHYTISISGATTAHTYKYSSGASWDFEEVTADGGHVDSRTYNANDVVAKWKAVYDPDAVPQELVYNVTVPAGTTACYIAMDTDPAQEGWEFTAMTKVDDTHYTLTRTGLKSDAYKYACQPSWDYAEKTADGNDVANRVWAENDVVAKWATPAAPAAKCYLMGIGGDWTTGIEMEEDGDQFKLLCQPIAEGEQFKFKYGDTWTTDVENYEANGVAWVESYPGSDQYNITLPAGNYDFYYKKNENKVWIGVCTPATPETYTRTVTPGNYGTICLPYASSSYTGAEFYEVSWLQKSGETPVNLYLDQLADGNQLVAGKPYIFRATSSELTVTYTGEAVAAPVPGANGLTGSFDAIPAGGVLTGNYVVAQNKFWTATATAYADENRAYINATIVPTTEPAKVPGRRRVSLGAAGENAETGIDNIITTDTPVKVIENGQLIIIRNGERFNVQGQKL